MLELVTAGESHGPGILAVLTGLPAGFTPDFESVRAELARRQDCAGRSARRTLESNDVKILAGLRNGKTIGSPLVVFIPNGDVVIDERGVRTVPRPGHADLPGMARYRTGDAHDIAERASARATAALVAAGAVCAQVLAETGVRVLGFTMDIGGEVAPGFAPPESPAFLESLRQKRNANRFHALEPCPVWAEMLSVAEEESETLGGVFAVVACGLPPGLGSHARFRDKLDARIARALVSIPAVKGVEFGAGFAGVRMRGSEYHGRIVAESGAAVVSGSQSGGFAGGMTDGSPLVVRCAVKPLPTHGRGMESVDTATGENALAPVERHDTCAVSAAAIIGEHAVALEVLAAVIERTGACSMAELKERVSEIRC